jgi:hypothetical protein
MASTANAKVLSSFPAAQPIPAVRAVRAVPPPAPRAASGWLQGLRDVLGGWLILAAVVVLWTVTWAAVAGPLSPAHEAAQSVAVSSVESAR